MDVLVYEDALPSIFCRMALLIWVFHWLRFLDLCRFGIQVCKGFTKAH